MATTGRAFGIALGIYSAICLGIFLLFSFWRRAPWGKHFYAPKSYAKGQPLPKHISARRPFAWITTAVEAPEPAVLRFAGMDALMYITILRLGIQLFLGISLLVLVIALPINLTGGQVARLMAAQAAPPPASSFTYWLPVSIAGPMPDGGEGGVLTVDSTQPTVVEPPDFYVHGLPPAPAALEWWEYAPDVPLLPQPGEVLGPNYTRFGWRYQADYQAVVYRFSDLDKTTMANVEAGSPRLYAHAVLAWAVTLFTLWLLYRFNKVALRLRMYYLRESPPGAEAHTVLLTDIPGVASGTLIDEVDRTLLRFLPGSLKQQLAAMAKQGVKGISSQLKLGGTPAASGSKHALAEAAGDNSTGGSRGSEQFSIPAARPEAAELRLGVRTAESAWDQALRQLSRGATIQEVVDQQMRAAFGDEFDQAFLVRDTAQLDPVVEEYRTLVRSTEELLDHYLFLKARHRDIKVIKVAVVPAALGAWGLRKYGPAPLRVNALQHYRDRLVELRRLIAEERELALQRVLPSAFVTFKTRRAQVVAAHSLLHHDQSAWRCHPAPAPGEVVWSNLGLRFPVRRCRRLLLWAAFAALALFYTVPVAAAQSLLALNSVTGWLQGVPVLNALVTAILPGLVLKIFLKLLPGLLGLMNRFAGAVSESAVDLGVVTQLFAFQVVTLFFGSFIAGSFANQIKQFVQSPSSIITVLGTAAPQTALFFTTYLMLQALLAKPLSLLRLPGLVVFWLRHRLAATERAKARVWEEQQQTYGGLIPDDTISLLLGLVFSLVCPIIAPMALIYFLVVFTVWKYQLLYVKSQRYQSGGQAWTRVFTQVCFSLGLFQLTMVGILGIKRSVGAPLIVLPLVPITVAFWWWCRGLFWGPLQTLALADAAQLDEQGGDQQSAGPEHHPGTAVAAAADASQRYLAPAFCLDLGQGFDALLFEADAVLRFLDTGVPTEDLEAIQAQQTATADAAYFSAAEEAQPGTDRPGPEASWGAGHRASTADAAGEVSRQPSVVMMHNPAASLSRATSRRTTSGDVGSVAGGGPATVGAKPAASLDVELGVAAQREAHKRSS
ncbi:hypothetical protein ABPG75_005179 [Micractinium tetrahymenae]